MLVPNVILGGAQKGATSTLATALSDHPEVYLGQCKEPHFFDQDTLYDHGDGEFYEAHYSGYSGEKIILDATPNYLAHPESAQRIYERLGPDVRFIFSLRNPVDRAVSAYNHYARRRLRPDRRSLDQIVPSLTNECSLDDLLGYESQYPLESLYSSYVANYFEGGCYARHLDRYFQYFPRDQFLFLTFEEVTRQQHQVLQKIAQFLKIPFEKFSFNDEIHANSARIYKNGLARWTMRRLGYGLKPLLPGPFWRSLQRVGQRWFTQPQRSRFSGEVYASLLKLYGSEIDRTVELTGLDLSHWKG